MSSDKLETKTPTRESSPLAELAETFLLANAYLNGDEGLLPDKPPIPGFMSERAKEITNGAKDATEAVKLYTPLAIEAEYAPAQYQLGHCYHEGKGVEKNILKAKELYERAAAQGYKPAVEALEKLDSRADSKGNSESGSKEDARGDSKGNSKGDSKSDKKIAQTASITDSSKETKTESSATTQSKLVEVAARFALAERYLEGDQKQEGIKIYEELAAEGYALAQFKMGECYEKGLVSGKKNMWEAMLWYEMAAEQEYGPAALKMAEDYENGYRFKSHENAIKWRREAKKLGSELKDNVETKHETAEAKEEKLEPPATDKLNTQQLLHEADNYLFGKGVEKDRQKAVGIYQMLAESGDRSAQFRLGYCYQHGWGVKINNHKAVVLYRMAARSSDKNTQMNAAEALWSLEGSMIAASPIYQRMKKAIENDVVFVGETHAEGKDFSQGLITPARRAVMMLIHEGKIHTLSVEVSQIQHPEITNATGRVKYDHFQNCYTDDAKSVGRGFLPEIAEAIRAANTPAWVDVLSIAQKKGVEICFHDAPISLDYLKKNQNSSARAQSWVSKKRTRAHVAQGFSAKVGERNEYSAKFLTNPSNALLTKSVLVLGGADHFKNLSEDNTEIVKALHTSCGKKEENFFDLSDKKLIFGPVVDFPMVELEAAIQRNKNNTPSFHPPSFMRTAIMGHSEDTPTEQNTKGLNC